MNPLLSVKSPQISSQMIRGIKSYMSAIKIAQNPSQAMRELSEQNPQIKELLDLCQGRNPKDVFVEQCERMGYDPKDIIKLLM